MSNFGNQKSAVAMLLNSGVLDWRNNKNIRQTFIQDGMGSSRTCYHGRLYWMPGYWVISMTCWYTNNLQSVACSDSLRDWRLPESLHRTNICFNFEDTWIILGMRKYLLLGLIKVWIEFWDQMVISVKYKTWYEFILVLVSLNMFTFPFNCYDLYMDSKSVLNDKTGGHIWLLCTIKTLK